MVARLKHNFLAFLRWSESYTKTDMLYMAHGGFWLTLAKGIAMFSSLILATAMANLIPPEVIGTYKFVLSGAGIIGAFSLTAIGTAITQAVARGYEGALHSGILSYLKWSLGMVVISLAATLYYYVTGTTRSPFHSYSLQHAIRYLSDIHSSANLYRGKGILKRRRFLIAPPTSSLRLSSSGLFLSLRTRYLSFSYISLPVLLSILYFFIPPRGNTDRTIRLIRRPFLSHGI